MNRKNFAFSWARKLFFGLSWPLTLVLSLTYLKSFIFPASLVDVGYFVTSLIGFTGVVNLLVYFLLFSPVTLLIPGYYITRIWSLILILALNLLLFLDALCFSTYGNHLYSYLAKAFYTNGFEHLVPQSFKIAIYVILAIGALVIWFRGELLWRKMQTRFSNPISNWYLVLIVIFLVIGKSILHFGPIHPRLASIIPGDSLLVKVSDEAPQFNQKFYYSVDKVQCPKKSNPNVIVFLIKDWNESDVTEESMPNFTKMERHFVKFNSHMKVNQNFDDSLFSFYFSLPAGYRNLVSEQKPLIMQELGKRGYDILNFHALDVQLNDWMSERTSEKPFYLTVTMTKNEADGAIQDLILKLQKNNLLGTNHLLISGIGSQSDRVPFYYAYPDRKASEVSKVTTPYDVMPNLMENLWGCKNVYEGLSLGHPFNGPAAEWYVASTDNGFKVIDELKSGEILVQDGSITKTGEAREELIFSALKVLNRFSKP